MPLPGSQPTLLSFRKQNLLIEFSSLRFARLDGVFVSITPGDPSLWISFPPSYPSLPPLVTFSTDVFHPLLTPLTTYTYTTGSSDTDTVSATDDERLPPGGFSLRHGFPHWFGRARKSAVSSRNTSGSGMGSPPPSHTPVTSEAKATVSSIPQYSGMGARNDVSIIRILEYIRSTFSDEGVLDSIPLDAAANPGAYHAWRAYRVSVLGSGDARSLSQLGDGTPTSSAENAADLSTLGRNRRPGEWNWEGVWEERVKKAIRASLSEPVLYGGSSGGEDVISFCDVDDETVMKMKEQWSTMICGASGA